jgi:hypothetical protein
VAGPVDGVSTAPPERPVASVQLRVQLPILRRNWYELGLDPAQRQALIATQWAELRSGAAELDRPEVAAAFASTLDSLADHYARRGSQIAAVEWLAATGRPPQSVLDVRFIEPLSADSPLDEAQGLEGLLMLPSEDDASPRTVELVELPAGPAVRLRLLGPGGRDASGRDVICDVVQYWLPLGLAPATALVTCSSSLLEDGDRNAEMLDLLVNEMVIEPAPVASSPWAPPAR